MPAFESVAAAAASLWSYRMRSGFAVLGTYLGVTFLVAVVTLLKGVDVYLQEDLGRRVAGFDEVVVKRAEAVAGRPAPPAITSADATWLTERTQAFGPAVPVSHRSAPARAGSAAADTTIDVDLVLTNADYFDVRGGAFAAGRPLATVESTRGLPLAVVSSTVAADLFGGAHVGGTLRLQGRSFRVVGVLAMEEGGFGTSVDRRVIIPAGASSRGFSASEVDEIVVRVPSGVEVGHVRDRIRTVLEERRRDQGWSGPSVEVETAEGAMEFLGRITGILLIALPALVGTSLVVGGFVIANIMLISVTERTREIGVRRALGARKKDILSQFIIEACVLSGAGAILGIGTGWLLAVLVSVLTPIPAWLSVGAVAGSAALALVVGLAAGVYPARKAARLHPIQALNR